MARDWEATFAGWTGPASDAEQSRYDWTKDEITTAIRAWDFGDASLSIYPKGSYPNYTNVVRDSDVDIAVEMTNIIDLDFIHEAEGMRMQNFGITPYSGDYDARDLKNDVEDALIDHFGHAAVKRGRVAIHVRQSDRGLAADVVACEQHRDYVNRLGGHHRGIKLFPDRGPEIHNYPRQHHDRGVEKNGWTHRRYKATVRILKRLENEMVEMDVIEPVASFFIESLVWNVPNRVFNMTGRWTGRVQEVLGHIYQEISDQWMEANNVKFLVGDWSLDDGRRFADAAWDYVGY